MFKVWQEQCVNLFTLALNYVYPYHSYLYN